MAQTRDPTSPDLEPYAITGIHDGIGSNGRVPLRRDINEWYASKKDSDRYQVQLFLLALEAFHARNEHDKLSYFQIAGIHGFPNVPWNENTKPKAKDKDYCTHNSLLFPFWHRPYILLFEQVVYNIMCEEIIPSCLTTNPKNAHDKDFHGTLRDAVKTWRIPYWDWAATDDLPPIVKLITVEIDIKKVPSVADVPSGHMFNPLNKFEMPSKEPMGAWGIQAIPEDNEKTKWRPYHKSKGVSRCATYDNKTSLDVEPPPHWVKGTINNEKAAEALRGGKWYDDKDPYTLKENVYRLFTSHDLKQFAAFSTTLYSQPEDTDKDQGLDQHGNKDVAQSYSSLEFIHNNIHSWVGGPDGMTAGHMADVPVAGFDPVFWLHHVNIDRLCAIWQTLNPDSWFDKQEEQLQDPGNWSMAEATWATPTTNLAPFHWKAGASPEYYTANKVRKWTDLGYTYPELQPWNYKNHDEYIKSLCTTLNKEYGATKNLINKVPKLLLDPTAIVAQMEELLGLENDYVINAVYKKFALGGVAFTINFYLSHRDGSETVRTRVGRVYNFSSAIGLEDDGHCKNCITQARADVKASGSIPLTNVMIKKAQDPDCPLTSLVPDDTINYLRDYLSWDVTDRSGEVVPLDEHNPFIEVHVAIGKPEHAGPADILSRYHSYTLVSRITDNKVGGAGYTPGA